MKKNNKIVKLVKLFQSTDFQIDDKYDKQINQEPLNESELREYYTAVGLDQIINVIFWHNGYEVEYSLDLIRELFLDMTEDQQKYLEQSICEHLGDYKCDLDLDTSKTQWEYLSQIYDMKTYLHNVYNYIVATGTKNYWLLVRYNDWCQSYKGDLKKLLKEGKQYLRSVRT